jgi:uncharacterized repeat protein (TIGR03803 family)
MLAIALFSPYGAFAQTETLLHTFTGGNDGSEGGNFINNIGSDAGNLVFGPSGNLYGSAVLGGTTETVCDNDGCGVIYELAPNGSGEWAQNTLHMFSGSDGFWPQSGVVLDQAGNIYGTTEWGGPCLTTGCGPNCLISGCGVAYELSPAGGGQWNFKILHAFTGGADGANPWGNLILDASGNLYGGTVLGGSLTKCPTEGCGVIFELSPQANGSWKETVLHTFAQTDGDQTYGGLTLDPAGNLFGTTAHGGPVGWGVVFRLAPGSSGKWTYSIVHAFSGYSDGANPAGNLLIDRAGNIFGATTDGGVHACGGDEGCGVIFGISRSPTGEWIKHNIYTVPSSGSTSAVGSIAADSSGNLYETLLGSGGIYGAVIELSPGSSGWTESTVFDFSGIATGEYPNGGVVLDSAGNLYGATRTGGSGSCSCGVVYEIVR